MLSRIINKTPWLSSSSTHVPLRVTCSSSASKRVPKSEESSSPLRTVACGLLAVCTVATASPVIAANQRLPPLSTEPNRCERAFVGNTICQANGVYNKPLDLRFCDYTNEKSNLKGKSVAAALMSDAKFDGADMSEAVMSKAYAVGASFKVQTSRMRFWIELISEKRICNELYSRTQCYLVQHSTMRSLKMQFSKIPSSVTLIFRSFLPTQASVLKEELSWVADD
ncbi:hypothetical protein ES332_A10G001800v1 [Gossypium tomentosum]|uniref:Uncharacterized protein n=1 Tax=Gossypium tomentosum TaxID=34277 RepID=A0A5D2NPL9_GOSTO|nr:hypothetical protein ES332_A10G001800v1 [Gossypium tomentosum]